jgi:hypothetical protein
MVGQVRGMGGLEGDWWLGEGYGWPSEGMGGEVREIGG